VILLVRLLTFRYGCNIQSHSFRQREGLGITRCILHFGSWPRRKCRSLKLQVENDAYVRNKYVRQDERARNLKMRALWGNNRYIECSKYYQVRGHSVGNTIHQVWARLRIRSGCVSYNFEWPTFACCARIPHKIWILQEPPTHSKASASRWTKQMFPYLC
jgi:hypothetical protein